MPYPQVPVREVPKPLPTDQGPDPAPPSVEVPDNLQRPGVKDPGKIKPTLH